MAYPVRIVNMRVSCDSSGSLAITPTGAGNLLVVILGFGGSASASGDVLTEAIPGATPSIWYCESVGGTASVSFSAGGPGMFVFELAADSADWILLDAEQGAGSFSSTNMFCRFYPAEQVAIQTFPSLVGDDGNCCYFAVLKGRNLDGSIMGASNQKIFSADWRMHPQFFVVDSGLGYQIAGTVFLALNATGVQQFQLWLNGGPASTYVGSEGYCVGAAFGTGAGGGSAGGIFQPNVGIIC